MEPYQHFFFKWKFGDKLTQDSYTVQESTCVCVCVMAFRVLHFVNYSLISEQRKLGMNGGKFN